MQPSETEEEFEDIKYDKFQRPGSGVLVARVEHEDNIVVTKKSKGYMFSSQCIYCGWTLERFVETWAITRILQESHQLGYEFGQHVQKCSDKMSAKEEV